MNFANYNGLQHCINQWLLKLPRFDLVVGVERSGIIPACMLALYWNVPYLSLSQFLNKGLAEIVSGQRGKYKESTKIRTVLIVDDSVYRGTTMAMVRRATLHESVKNLGLNIKFGTVFMYPGSEKYVDYFFIHMDQPRCFQWNVLHHHPNIPDSCFDMDGVLCRKPTAEENDDGIKYEEFLKTTEPLYIPSLDIGCIVTSRLEKYRGLTLDWLRKHKVKYKQLVMSKHKTKEERIKAMDHAVHKANIYKNACYTLFFEDEPWQAKEIHELTAKPVICVSDWRMV